MVGGSTAFGTGLARDADTFPSRLAVSLGARVINAAVVGHQSGQELAFLVTELLDLRPDLVIALDGWNDYGFRSVERFLGVAAFGQVEAEMKQLARLVYPPSMWERAVQIPLILFPRAGKSVMSRADQLAARMGLETRFLPPREARVEIPRAAEAYAANVRKMWIVSEGFGSEFLCLIQPQNRLVRFAKSNRQYDRFVEIATARLARDGVPFVNLNAPDWRDPLRDERFLDLVHLDATGNRVLAGIAAGEIRRRGWLGKKRRAGAPAG